MPLWDKLKTELDRAGRVAQGALDEGKLRLEVFRVRQLADKAAQTIGYAVHRARAAGTQLDAESLDRLGAALAAHETEVARLEARLAEATAASPGTGDASAASPDGAASAPGAGSATPPVNPS